MTSEPLIPPHGGYRRLKSFQLAQLIYDLTVRFCDLYIDRRSRTRDQMVQAARSGVQNIAEGSQASGTSKKTELKLTNVARASLEELRLDYEDFLRQRGMPLLPPDSPEMKRFKANRCATLSEVQTWVKEERLRARAGQTRTNTDTGKTIRTNTDTHGRTRTNLRAAEPVSVGEGPCESVCPSSALAANAALSLLNLCCFLLDRQLASQANAFEHEGGFTERLHRVRSQARVRSVKGQP